MVPTIAPAEAIVAATLNAAYSLGVQDRRGSLDVDKRGDVIIVDCPHPNELFLGLADEMLSAVIVDGGSVPLSPEQQMVEGMPNVD